MGGKNKSSQRTKNNARPSSSGRSAEMLGNVPVGFVGFSGMATEAKTMSLVFPLSPVTPDSDLSTEYLLVIKKLNKKDPITKTKALLELSDLVNESALEQVTNALPYWCRLYRILTSDTEHKVREATQTTHGVIVSKCGRAIAPYLKQIIPTWLTAQYDNFAPAASSAQTSLKAAFPESKLPEVISFCKAEMISQISSNIVGDAQAVFLNSKAVEPDVAEMMYQRVVMGTLQGFNFFVKHLPADKDEWLWMEQLPILDSGKFWKLAFDKCPYIRSAWFGVIARQIERYPDKFGEKYGSKATKVLINNLTEKDPLVAMQLWECFLLLTAHLKNWYSWVDKKEQLSKGILDTLWNGGWGNATHLAAIILPLLANLPAEMLTKEFYSMFFVAMIDGLNKKAILSSKSYRQACITSIGECLKFVSINEIETFALEIITSALRLWLEKILEHPYDTQTRNHIIKHSATVMVSILKYWLKQSTESKNGDKFDHLVRNFWQNKCSTIVQQVEKLALDHEHLRKSVEGHTLLLQTLKTSYTHETKKRAKIKFETDEQADEQTDEKKSEVEKLSESDVKMQETYVHNLNKAAYTTCSHYLQFANKKEISLPVFVPLYTLLCEFDSRELFISIAKDFAEEKGKEASLYSLYDGVFRRWLSGDTMRCKEVVHMTFLLVPHMSSEEQNAVFKSFNEFVPSVVEEIISKCLSHPYSSYGYVQRWMRSEVVDVTLAAICKRLVKRGDSHSKNLLLMSFSQYRNGDIIISEQACSGIMMVLQEALQQLDSAYLDVCASLASQLVAVLIAGDKRDAYKKLLLQMFTLNATVKPNDENMSEDTWWELKTSWQDGLSTMDEEERTSFINDGVKLIHQVLIEHKQEIDTKKVDDIIELATSLMGKFNENYKAEDNIKEIVAIVKALFDERDESLPVEDNIEMHALTYDCLTGRLNFLYDDRTITKHIINNAVDEKATLLKRNSLNTNLYKSLTRAKFLSVVIFGPQKKPENAEDEVTEEDVDKTIEWSTTLLSNLDIQEEYLLLLHDYAILQTLHIAYAFWPHHSLIVTGLEIIGSQIKEIISHMTKEHEVQYLTSLSVKAFREGFYWAYARKLFQELTDQKDFEDYVNVSYVGKDDLDSRLKAVGDFHRLHASCDGQSPELVSRERCRIMLHCFHALHRVDPATVVEPLNGDRLDYAAIISSYNPTCDKDVLDIMNESWCKLVSTAATMDAFSALVVKHGWSMPEQQWDTVVLTLCSCLMAVERAKRWWGSIKVALVARAALRLLQVVQGFVKCASAESAPKQTQERREEWLDVVRPGVAQHVYEIMMEVLGTSADIELGVNHMVLLKGLCSVLHELDWRCLPEETRAADLSLERIRQACLGVLAAPTHHGLKYLGYYVLKGLARCFAYEDYKKLSDWCAANADTDDIKERPKFSISSFDEVHTHLEEMVDTELSAVMLGEDSVAVVPHTDSYSVMLSYLLLVEFLLELCAGADSDVQQQYIEFFRTGSHLELVMSSCMRLIPPEVLERAREPSRAPPVPSHIADMFTERYTFTVAEPPLARHVSALACRCVTLVLGGPGAVVARGWHGALAGRLSKTIDNVVAAHVTPAVLRPMFASLQDGANKLADCTVTAVWSSYEVIAECMVDDMRVELQIKFGTSHPLTIPKLQSVRGPVNHMQRLSFYLSYQNGTILETIRLWLSMLTRQMEKTTLCYVCYSRLHPQTGQLPRVRCHTCKNHFHTKCIYKWFRSSTRSTCPLCRNLM